MSTELSEPGVEAGKLADRLEQLQKTLKGVHRVLKELSSPRLLADDRKLSGRIEQLRTLESDVPELSRTWQSLAEEFDQWQKHRQKTRPLKFGRELNDAASAAGIDFAPLTADPPTYWLSPFTVEARFSRGVAVLFYARESLGDVELDPGTLLAARHRHLAALEGEGFDPVAYFDLLQTAYRRVQSGAESRAGDRVELVELLPELAFLMQSLRFRHNPTRENYRPYGRVRLAYDLARLRKSGILARDGARLTLGTATIGTTRKKDRVLYLEDSAGRGQYYLTIAFQPS